jgi:hypothetical protein
VHRIVWYSNDETQESKKLEQSKNMLCHLAHSHHSRLVSIDLGTLKPMGMDNRKQGSELDLETFFFLERLRVDTLLTLIGWLSGSTRWRAPARPIRMTTYVWEDIMYVHTYMRNVSTILCRKGR